MIVELKIEIPDGSIPLVDNRVLRLKGSISQPGDYEEAYRLICRHYKKGLTEMRAMTRDTKSFSLVGLVRLCRQLDLMIIIDSAQDFFLIRYHEKDSLPIETEKEEVEEVLEPEEEFEDMPENKTPEEVFEDISNNTPEIDAAFEEDIPEEIQKDEDDEEDDFSDLF